MGVRPIRQIHQSLNGGLTRFSQASLALNLASQLSVEGGLEREIYLKRGCQHSTKALSPIPAPSQVFVNSRDWSGFFWHSANTEAGSWLSHWEIKVLQGKEMSLWAQGWETVHIQRSDQRQKGQGGGFLVYQRALTVDGERKDAEVTSHVAVRAGTPSVQ